MTTRQDSITVSVDFSKVKRPNVAQQFLHFMRTKPLGGTGVVILLFATLVALGAPAIVPHDPWDISGFTQLLSPNSEFWFGTDILGRDIFSRTIYGTRVSLFVGVLTMLVATSIGAFVGITSAYYGGKTDLIIQRFIDSITYLPSLVLGLALMAAFGPGFLSLITAMIIIFTSRGVRIIRSQALSIKELPYVDASVSIGGSDLRIMLRHILPNTFGPMMVVATTMIGSAIVIEASLSFLGVGLPPHIISWGGMLSGQILMDFASAPWIGIFPGMALTLVVFAINVFGDALRDVFDPRLRGR